MSGFALPIGVNLAMSFLWEGNLESPIERDLSRKSKSTLNAPNQEINGMNHGECQKRIRL